tara:strand:+ start:198 stop:368 length:171 start_codon:yes stop_codon:yes gene_type:complete
MSDNPKMVSSGNNKGKEIRKPYITGGLVSTAMDYDDDDDDDKKKKKKKGKSYGTGM